MPAVRALRIAMRMGVAIGLGLSALGGSVRAQAGDSPIPPSPRSAVKSAIPAPKTTSSEWILRATVRLHNGKNTGSGTIIASTPQETLILTAWHVIDGARDLKVALHRYNFGLEKIVRDSSEWPRMVSGTVVASRKNADIAIVRLKGIGLMPYVARMELADREPPRDTVVASVGIVQGNDLTYWESRVWGQALIDFHRGGGERLFIMTQKPPEFGRSGGGLYRIEDQTLIGVAVGQAHLKGLKAPIGVFAGARDVRELLENQNLDIIVARSRSFDGSRHRAISVNPSSSVGSGSGSAARSSPARTARSSER